MCLYNLFHYVAVLEEMPKEAEIGELEADSQNRSVARALSGDSYIQVAYF